MFPDIRLAAAYLALSLPFGPNSPPPSLDFGIQPAVYYSGRPFSTPFGYAHDGRTDGNIHAEEQLHMRQMEELGPAFWLAYGLTGGAPFEPYDQRRGIYPAADSPGYLDRAWQPQGGFGNERKFPQFRATFGEDPSLELLPGYHDTLLALLELIK